MQYLCLVYCEPQAFDRMSDAESKALDRDSLAYDRELERSGRFKAVDASGQELARANFPGLAAPVDLNPRTVKVRLQLPQGAAKVPLQVVVGLQGDQAEVTMANNRVRIDPAAEIAR